jgi:predicted secreted protein
MAYKLGLDAKLFYGEAGTQGKTELTNVKDVTLSLTSGEADVTTRGAAGWRAYAATLKEGSLEWDMIWDTEDAGFKAIQKAFFDNEAVALFVSDGAGNGLDADFVITAFSRSEPLEEAITVSVTARPTNVTRAPAWVEGQN